jgi:hypothetical protein
MVKPRLPSGALMGDTLAAQPVKAAVAKAKASLFLHRFLPRPRASVGLFINPALFGDEAKSQKAVLVQPPPAPQLIVRCSGAR